jgi:hypothetical protein
MTPDNNKIHFLTNVTSLLIPQRMNSCNNEEKVNFVKWYYSGLSFGDMQATFPVFYPERPIPSLTCQISYWVIQNDCGQIWQLCTKIYVATVWVG